MGSIFRKGVAHVIAGSLAALFVTAPAFAQDDADAIEEIVVEARFQRNLVNALDAKRMATVISDGISADDIGAIPAVDLGEALQFVPGVQLNREGERRESSVNLRGMPSGFVNTTANGVPISNPTRSTKAFGAPTPFGAFDSAVFNGVRVYKSQSADMIEGGIAGTIDMQVGRALDGPEQKLALQVGLRSEDLADEADSEFVLSGAKHLSDGTVGINGTLAYSDQTFRRDTIKINRYDPLSSRFDAAAMGMTFDEWRIAQGVPDGAVVEMPGELRQSIETNEGTRLSFAGGIEFKPSDALRLGANILYTERDMDDNGFFQADLRPRGGGALVSPNDSPVATGATTSSGQPIYAVSDIQLRRAPLGQDSREWDVYQQTQSLLLDAEWTSDDWAIAGAVTLSESEAEWDEVLQAYRLRPVGGPADTGWVSGRLATGQGNIGDFVADLVYAPGALDIDGVIWPAVQTNINRQSSINGVSTDPNSHGKQWGVTGTWEYIERDVDSIDLSAERFFDDQAITSVKFGYRHSDENQDSRRMDNSTVGIDLTNTAGFGSAMLTDAPYVGSSSYFGGDAPGYFSAQGGWISWDAVAMTQAMVDTIDYNSIDDVASNGEPKELTPRGFIRRSGRDRSTNYDTNLVTDSLFAMANFEFEMGGVPTSGNFGVRYVSSDLEAGAPYYEFLGGSNTVITHRVAKHDYDYTLPSLNVAWDLKEDLKLRFAYSKSIVRPNLRSGTPASFMTANFLEADDDPEALASVSITLPGAQVDPFDAASYDLSLEWYNREGSAVTVAFFTKDIDNYFATETLCDNALLDSLGYDVGNVSVVGDQCVTDGADSYVDSVNPGLDLLPPGSEITVRQLRNIDNTITVSGFEVSVQQNLDFLPHPWNGLGGVLNYTRAKQDSSDDVVITGISEDTWNAIAYFEQGPFGIRLAYNYRSDYDLDSVGTFNGAGSKRVKAAGRLDLSTYYNVTDQLSIGLKGYNLTEELYEEYEQVQWQPRATHFDGRIFVLSANYTF